MKVSRTDVESNLPKKGFVRNEKGHHIFFHFWNEGKATSVFTKISHTKKHRDIDCGILSAMRKQLKLDNNKDFVALVECPMSLQQYQEVLKTKKLL